jgi:hypothetical protein
MEIHPPHGGIHSVRDFLVQLSMIVLGILIALSLEGVLQWAHHRSLAREARANLAVEISENHRRTVEWLPRLNTSEQQLQHFLEVIHTLQANRKTPPGDLQLSWAMGVVDETNWNSAINTDAISYMDLSEVQRYTRLYALQHAFTSAQDKAFETVAQVQSAGTLLDKDAKAPTDHELEQAEDSVRLALANTRVIEQLGRALAAEYEKHGGGRQPDRAVTASR